MERQLRVLLLEDQSADAELIAAELRRHGFALEWDRVDTEDAFLAALDDPPDLILSDYNLPSWDGLRALQALKARGLDIPFILVTGAVGEEVATTCMREGAADYLLKDRLGRVGKAVEQALERHSLREQRRTAVERIRFLNRLLDTIREVNRLIARERDRERLLAETCRVVVEHGRFRMAWIGEVDRASGRIEPVAAAGEDASYLKEVAIRHDGGRESAGPCGRSVREGQTAVSDDIATDTSFGPWREAALERGFRSSISLPLRVDDEIEAVLAVYSSEPRAFEGEIVDLLEELAADLGFAMGAITMREEHERAAAALADSEKRYRLLADNANDVIWQTDMDGRFTYLSPAWEALTGRSVAESLGKSSAGMLTSKSLERIQVAVEKLLAQPTDTRGRTALVDLEHLRSDGSIVDVEVRAGVLVDEWGQPVTIQGITRDISGRKRAEERFRTIFESAPDAYYLCDLNGVFIDGNRAAEQLTGYSKEELVGGSFLGLDLLPERELSKAAELLTVNSRGEPTGPDELVLRRKEGGEVEVEITTHPVDLQGQTVVLGIARDITERRRAEEALRESERRLSTLMGNLPGMAYRCRNDGDWTMLFASEGTHALTGYTPEELVGGSRITFGELIHPDDRERVWQEVQAAAEGPRPFVLEYRINDANGREKWVWEQGVESEPGVLEGLLMDITERKRAEVALAESERFAFATIDALSKHIAVLDEHGTIIAVNRAWREFAAANPPVAGNVNEGADYLAVCDNAHGEDREIAAQFAAGIRAVLAGDLEEYTGEYPCHSPEEQRWFTCRVSRFPAGGPLRVVVAHENISQRKRAEEALRESEGKYRSIVDNIGLGVNLVSPDMRIMETNRRLLDALPIEIDVEKHPVCYQVLTAPPREEVCENCPTALTLRDGCVHESTTQTAIGGDVRSIRIVSSPVFNDEGEVTAAIELVEDVTVQRSLEDQLRQAQKMEAVGRLAGGVAHDFNNLLQAFSGLTHGLRLHAGDPAAFSERIEELSNMIRRGSQLTRQLLLFSRREAYHPESLDLADVVQGTEKLFRHLLREDIRLETRRTQDPLPIEADRGQLEQVLVNLAVNAQDAMPDGGRLEMSTFLEGDGWATLVVQDSGSGIPEAIRNKVFEPFFTTKEAGIGTGLGLAVVHGIVTRAGGNIEVESETGKGATFRIRLPLRTLSTTSPEVAAAAVPERPRGAGQRVLVVEDEEPVRRSICEMLEIIGYEAVGAESVAAVLAAVGERDLDLVISDMVLPDGSGVEVIAGLREHRPSLPAVAISGYSTDSGLLQDLEAKNIRFLQKPFDFDELAEEVGCLLDTGQDEGRDGP